MDYFQNIPDQLYSTRREFIKKLSTAGAAVYLGIGDIFALDKSGKSIPDETANFEYKYSTVSVKHVKEIGRWFDKLKSEEKIGKNETFRSYIGAFKFDPEEILHGAKSLILVSNRQKISSVVFNYKGKKTEILIPTGYADDGLTFESVKARIMEDIIKDSAKKLQEQVHLPLKTMSVRSGLADYGKNNITFVDEFGSFHQLIGLYTDKELEDNWRPLNMLRLCKGCSICIKDCPTKCIREENFVIEVDKCLPLFNELPDPFPEWLPSEVHHTLVGCLKCQYTCPANENRIKDIDKLADITEEETGFLLGESKNEKIHKQIAEKLKRFPSVNNLDYFRRNFKLAFANIING
ncbi:4Fe-4S double cluster binding domain-containing protein [candidate division KSB1 bacterium]